MVSGHAFFAVFTVVESIFVHSESFMTSMIRKYMRLNTAKEKKPFRMPVKKKDTPKETAHAIKHPMILRFRLAGWKIRTLICCLIASRVIMVTSVSDIVVAIAAPAAEK